MRHLKINSIFMSAVVALASFAPIPALAEMQIVAHGLSYHTHPRMSGQPWNVFNGGLALRYVPEGGALSYQAGGYRDSVFQPTLYGLADYTPVQSGPYALGGFAGAKQSKTTSLRPIAGLVARYSANGWAVASRLAPAPQSKGAVITLELSKSF